MFADFESRLGIPAINNGEPEPAGRHRVHLRRFVVMKGHLNTGNALPTQKFVYRSIVRLLIMGTVSSEQDNAVACPSRVIAKVPVTVRIEIDDRVDPAGAIKVGPLVSEAQVSLDDLGANGLEIH